MTSEEKRREEKRREEKRREEKRTEEPISRQAPSVFFLDCSLRMTVLLVPFTSSLTPH
jgi:hypothetical protein